MTSDPCSNRGLARVRHRRLLAFVLSLGLGIAVSHQPALAGVDGAREANGPSALANDARSSGEIVVAGREHDGNKNWGNGNNSNKNWSNKGNNNWNKNGNKNWSNNGNNNWNKNGDKNWSKKNSKYWNNNNNKHWGNYNNNWNKNWNNRAYVRNWYRKPYYGDFVGGIVLGSILAAAGAGIVPYAPEPYLCWYWADPYMYQGYWDYCY